MLEQLGGAHRLNQFAGLAQKISIDEVALALPLHYRAVLTVDRGFRIRSVAVRFMFGCLLSCIEDVLSDLVLVSYIPALLVVLRQNPSILENVAADCLWSLTSDWCSLLPRGASVDVDSARTSGLKH